MTPTTASADITENRMTSIKITSSLGIPSGYRGDGRGEERRGERRGRKKERKRERRGRREERERKRRGRGRRGGHGDRREGEWHYRTQDLCSHSI